MSNEQILSELRKISKLLTLVNAPVIEKELSKIASSKERKRMWVLIDGNRMPKDIANQVGVTPMAVSYFLNAGVAAGVIEYKGGVPPRRALDYVPPDWIELLVAEEEAAPEETPEKRAKSEEIRKNG